MRLLEACGSVYLHLPGEGETAELRNTEPRDAKGIQQLVARNAETLDQRFPGLTKRYQTVANARRAIASLDQNPNAAGLTIGLRDKEGYEPIIGRASVVLGAVACKGETILDEGINLALWLDKSKWNRGVGRVVLRSLIYHIGQARPENMKAPIFTLVDADNERSHRMVTAVGFETDGRPADYDFGGAPYADSVLYRLAA